jgi:SMI1-KNR4 cell-wall
MSEIKLQFEADTDAGDFDKKYVTETEEMLALELKSDFIAFLKNHNGGIPKKQYFKLGKNVNVVERFLCLFPDYEERPEFGQFDIGVVWSQIEDRLNEYLIPFAAVFPGDFVCFDYEDNDEPKVVLWDHNRSQEYDPVTKPVADSFEEFLSMLTDDDEGK